jgi:hypothetical protein
MLGFKRRVPIEVFAEGDNLLVGDCVKCMELLDATCERRAARKCVRKCFLLT